MIKCRSLNYLLFLLLFMTITCGDGRNFNSIFVTKNQKKRLDLLLQNAKAEYDAGDLEKAEELYTEAYNLNDQVEETAQGLALVYLAKAGFSPFDMVKKLIDKKTTASTTDKNQWTFFTDILKSFGVKSNTIEEMGTVDSGDENFYFKSIDILIPKAPGNFDDKEEMQSPRQQIPILFNINKAIKIICPFVAHITSKTTLNLSSETRYQCTKSSIQNNTLQSTFLFIIAHALEATILNATILYGTPSKSEDISLAVEKSGLYLRAQALSQVTSLPTENVNEFVTALSTLDTNINDALKTTEGQALYELFLDLTMLEISFSTSSAIPADVKDSITSMLNQTKTDGVTDLTAQLNLFKNQIKNGVFLTANDAVKKVLKNNTIEPDKKDELCATLKRLAQDIKNPSLPTDCSNL